MYRTLPLSRSRWALLALCLAALSPHAAAQRRGPVRDGFRLVAAAIGARNCQHFFARQDTLLFQANPAGAAETQTHIVADVVRDGSRLRLAYRLPERAAHRVVVDDGHVLQQWEPSQRLILVDQSHEETLGAQGRRLGLLHENYRCEALEEGAVNGVSCDLIVIRPRCHRGGSKRIWIDRAHHAILRTEEFDPSGRRCYLSFYETIRFARHVAPGLFRLAGLGQVRRLPRLLHTASGFGGAFRAAGLHGRLPAWLPPGYAMIGCSLAVRPEGGRAAILRYGDGLQTYSVFEESAGIAGSDPAPGDTLHTQFAHYGQRVWEMTDAGMHLTVIGDAMLPDGLGRDVLLSIMPATEGTLRSCLARDFGPGALATATALRRRGWGYEQIVSLNLYLRGHPDRVRSTVERMDGGQDWAGVASAQRIAPGPLDRKARAWIADALVTHSRP